MIAPMIPAVITRSQVKSSLESVGANGISFCHVQPTHDGVLLTHHDIYLFLDGMDVPAKLGQFRAQFVLGGGLHLPKSENHRKDRTERKHRSSYVADCVMVRAYLIFQNKYPPMTRSIPKSAEVNFQIVASRESAFSCARVTALDKVAIVSSLACNSFSASRIFARIPSSSVFMAGYSSIKPPTCASALPRS